MKIRFEREISLIILYFLILIPNVFAQSVSAEKKILPPVDGLIAVNHPDLKDVEKDVREQITAFRETLEKAAKTSPTTTGKLSDSYGAMGQIYHAYSFFAAAEECYTNASRLMPEDFRWLYLLGKISEAQAKTRQSIDFYKQAQKLRPDYLPVYINLGNAYLELDLPDLARASFENALKIGKDDPAALYGLGRVNYAQGNYEKASSLFEKVLSIAPEANRVHYSLALAYRGLKNIEKAKFHLSKQGAVGIRSSDPLFDALNDLKKGVRLRLVRGKTALEAGLLSEAEIEFRKALTAEPENVTALVNYGVTLFQLKKYSESAKHLEKAVALDPDNVNGRYNLAILFSLQKKHFPAIEHLRAILKINSKDNSARFLLAKELRSAALLPEALSEMLVVFNANP